MSSAQAERLEALLQSTATADRAEIRSVLVRLSAEIRERAKRGSASSYDYFVSSLRALSRVRGLADAELRCECLVECVNYFYQLGYQAKALEGAKSFLTLAALTGEPRWIRKSHNFAAAILADLGNIGEALVHFSRALDLGRQVGDLEGQASVLCNTGAALNYAGLYREAVPCLREGANLAECLPGYGEHVYASSMINLAQSYLYLGEYREGFKAAQSSLARTPEPCDAASTVSYVVRSLTLVQLALELGKLNVARDRARACAHQVLRSDSPRAHSLAEVARGLCEVHGGSVETGLRILEKVLDTTTVHSTKPMIFVALVKAYDEASQPERALVHMRALLDHIGAARAKAMDALLADGSADESMSLQALELREARLEARIAGREVLAERIQMLERLAVTADLKEEESGEHGYRVGRLAYLAAATLGWTPDKAADLESAARLHDIGKIAIPDRILLNTKALQEAERHFIATHTTIGAELLGRGNSQHLRMAEEIARYHHEWWNGEGYPSKLKGKRIPIHARIVAIADVFDALTHGRPFSPPWPIDKALDEIKALKGTQFDPELTDIFLELIAKLRAEHSDLDEYLGRAGRNSPFLQARNKIRVMLAEERDHEKMATVEGNDTRH